MRRCNVWLKAALVQLNAALALPSLEPLTLKLLAALSLTLLASFKVCP